MDIEDSHKFYMLQASWTHSTRNHLYRRCGLLRAEKVLEVGSATGVLTVELNNRTKGSVFSLDKDFNKLTFAKDYYPESTLVNADGLTMPFTDDTFDIVFCHYYLTWVSDIQKAIEEMLRILKKNGYLIIASEPDYDGIIEYPNRGIADALRKTLRTQGMENKDTGRKINSILSRTAVIENAGVVSYLYDGADLSLLEETCSVKFDEQKYYTFFQPIFYASARKK